MPIPPAERCQHIKMNGDRCGSPALRDQKFCYFHARCRPVVVDVSTSAAVPPAPFLLPVLEDAASIRLAITQVCEHLLHRRLDAKKAGVLLYAMQVASSNLDRPSKDKSQKKGEPEGREHDDVIGDDLAAEKPGEKPEQPQLSNPEKSS